MWMTGVRIEIEAKPGDDEGEALAHVTEVAARHGCKATNTRGECWPRSRGRTLVIKIDGAEEAVDEAVGEIITLHHGHL